MRQRPLHLDRRATVFCLIDRRTVMFYRICVRPTGRITLPGKILMFIASVPILTTGKAYLIENWRVVVAKFGDERVACAALI